MKGKALRQFIDDLYYNAETEFIFNGKKYIISGWLNEDETYTVVLYSIEENSQELFFLYLALASRGCRNF